MKVIKWVSWEEAEKMEPSIDTTGGYFEDGMRWPDYRYPTELSRPYIDALRAEIIEKNIRWTGVEHQNFPVGVPVFEDNSVATFSYRGWGDLLAAIWATEENKDYNYMDFYC